MRCWESSVALKTIQVFYARNYGNTENDVNRKCDFSEKTTEIYTLKYYFLLYKRMKSDLRISFIFLKMTMAIYKTRPYR